VEERKKPTKKRSFGFKNAEVGGVSKGGTAEGTERRGRQK